MASTRQSSPLGLKVLGPPYDRLGPDLPHEGALPESRHAGSIFALDLRCPVRDASLLESFVPALRRRFPAVPVIILVPTASAEAMRLASEASRLRVRAVLPRNALASQALRSILTRPVDLADDLLEWLGLRDIHPPPRARHLVRWILQSTEDLRPEAARASSSGIHSRTARHLLRKNHLPPPGAWRNLGRALRTALRMQAESDRTLLSLALELGYADHSGLCRHVQRAFGTRAREIRWTLGWEWMAARWLTIHGLGVPARDERAAPSRTRAVAASRT